MNQRPAASQTPTAKSLTEICPVYNEPYVGYIEESRQFVCNTQIREKQLLNVKFTALVCKQLKSEFF